MMKKNVLFSFLLVLTLGLFSSCSDKDDKKKDSKDGIYVGTLTVSMGEMIMSKVDNQELTLIRVDDTHHTLKLMNFKFNDAIVVPLIEVNTTITAEGNISGEAKKLEISLGALGKITADVAVDGTIVSEKAVLNIHVSAPLQPNSTPVQMLVKFDGKKK